MSPLDAVILGVVEGITEFLPISSTGHLALVSSVLGIVDSDFVKSFEIIIQLGAILAVVALYYKSFFNLELLKRIIVAFIPTGVIGLALYHVVKTYFLGNNALILAALAIGGIALIAFEYWHEERSDAVATPLAISYTQALFVGIFQAIAIIPGVSRSAATIVGGLWLGIKRTTIVEFSFLLAVPTMLAATGLDLLKNAATIASGGISELVIGFVVSFVVALVAIRWLLGYVRSHSFIPFGIYRIVIALIFFLVILR